MRARLRSTISILGLAGLVLLAAGCPETRGRSFAIPVPLQLQTVVAVDRQGNRVLAGAFAGRLQVAGSELASAGGTDIFVVKTRQGRRAGLPAPALRRHG